MKVETKKLHDDDYLYTLHNFGCDKDSKEKYDGLEVFAVKNPVVQSYDEMCKEYIGNVVIYEKNDIEIANLMKQGKMYVSDFKGFNVIPRAYVKYTKFTNDLKFMYNNVLPNKDVIDFKSLHDGYTVSARCLIDEPLSLHVGICEVKCE